MARGETSVTVNLGFALEDELDRMLGPVDRARANRWYEGDPTDEHLDDLLAALTNRAPLAYAAGLDLTVDGSTRPNRWREDHTIDAGVPPSS